MPIPQSQLETWSHQGSTGISSAAYGSIRSALLKASSPLSGRSVDISLQGSYANSTHIYANSDIDVVVLYENTFHYDMSALNQQQRSLHNQLFPDASYLWKNLRDDVFAALTAHYGSGSVTIGRKAIKVQTGHGRMTADVVPAVQFRRYATFVDQNTLSAHWGIVFFDSAGSQIVNYPKYHISRGEDKNSQVRTRGQYKATVRIFKNFRNHMVDNGLLADGVASSYNLECALHNVPDHLFIGNYSDTIPQIINHLLNTEFSGLMCQNGVEKLIGTGGTQWPQNNFVAFIIAANKAWQNW
jgi:hypothetical protein